MSTGIEGIATTPTSQSSSTHATQKSSHENSVKTDDASSHANSSSSSHNLPDYKGQEVNVPA